MMSITRSRLLGGLLALIPLPVLAHDGPARPRPRPPAGPRGRGTSPDGHPRPDHPHVRGRPGPLDRRHLADRRRRRKAVAQIAVADADPKKVVERAETVAATSTALATDLGESRYHSVVFDDLDPSTTYAYRVGDGVNWSEWVHARTASEKAEPFTFIYFGDAQTNLKSLWSRVIRGAYSDASRARFIVHAGDLVNRANRDAEWGEWFGAGGWVNAMVPSVPTPGNHEYEKPKAPESQDGAASTQSTTRRRPNRPRRPRSRVTGARSSPSPRTGPTA